MVFCWGRHPPEYESNFGPWGRVIVVPFVVLVVAAVIGVVSWMKTAGFAAAAAKVCSCRYSSNV